jgi:hypothetical protein
MEHRGSGTLYCAAETSSGQPVRAQQTVLSGSDVAVIRQQKRLTRRGPDFVDILAALGECGNPATSNGIPRIIDWLSAACNRMRRLEYVAAVEVLHEALWPGMDV